MKTLDSDYAYVSWAVGGSVPQVSLGGNATGSRVTATHGESTKGSVRGVSRKSRRNLLRHLSSINRTAFRAYKGRLLSLGLSYPTDYPEDPSSAKST